MSERPRRAERALAAITAVLLGVGVSVATVRSDAAVEVPVVRVGVCEPQTLIPGMAYDTCSTQVVAALFAPLVHIDPRTGAPVPATARSIETEDGRAYTIRLRADVTFSDGEPVTASSFVDAWNWLADPANAAPTAGFLEPVQGFPPPPGGVLSGLEVIDDDTFRVVLTRPFRPFLTTLAVPALVPLPSAFHAAPDRFAVWPVGNGAYRLSAPWTAGDPLHLEPASAGAVPVELVPYADTATAYLDLVGGNLDVAAVPAFQVGDAERRFGDRVVRRTARSLTFLAFPSTARTDVHLRRAIAGAIDREAIAARIWNGTRTPAVGLVPPGVPGHRERPCHWCEFDPERAQQALAASTAGTKTLRFAYGLGGPGGEARAQELQAIADQLHAVLGLTVSEIAPVPLPELIQQLRDGTTDAVWAGGFTNVPNAYAYLQPLLGTEGAFNHLGHEDGRFDRLLDEGAGAPSLRAELSRYRQAEDLMLSSLPLVPLFHGVQVYAHAAHVTSVVIDPGGGVLLAELRVADRNTPLTDRGPSPATSPAGPRTPPVRRGAAAR